MQLTVKNGKRMVKATTREIKAARAGLEVLQAFDMCCDAMDVETHETIVAVKRIVEKIEAAADDGQRKAVSA